MKGGEGPESHPGVVLAARRERGPGGHLSGEDSGRREGSDHKMLTVGGNSGDANTNSSDKITT